MNQEDEAACRAASWRAIVSFFHEIDHLKLSDHQATVIGRSLDRCLQTVLHIAATNRTLGKLDKLEEQIER